MSDMISRATAIEAFAGKPPEYYHTSYICDVIKELPAVDAVPVVQRWISVKDKLPSKQGFYLTFIPEMARVALYYNGYDWIVDDDFYAFGAYEITHWMPLPEPPKMDGDA